MYYDGNLIDTRVYDDAGRLQASSVANGVATDFLYHDDNTVDVITHSDASGFAFEESFQSWDPNKNLSFVDRRGSMTSYPLSAGYDENDRLINYVRGVNNPQQSWTLSEEGDWNQFRENGSTQTRTHGAGHELQSVLSGTVTQTIDHDVKGNTTIVPSLLRPDNSDLVLNWDFDNRLHASAVGTTKGVRPLWWIWQRFTDSLI